MSAQQLAASLADARGRISAAAERSGRDPAAVTLVAVTKTHSAQVVQEAASAGVREFGENRVQEALPKIAAIADWASRAGRQAPRWHLVGHLQRNKAKAALEHFAILHSLDSVRLAEALNERAEKPLDVFIEVNVAGEESKWGFAPAELDSALKSLGRLSRLRPLGLMTVAPIAEDEVVRTVFRKLRRLGVANGLSELSMGMSDDFEIAVEEGATCVRLGRVLFGERAT
ncbi:MAG TPA: YggS family pyridoxal phosphate-dependent enzyme [Dehalococcoidia bacterium]|nr:YggS family pyridoxal phosphate-dependent enzyme [Dehalococcoidia bacterium]